MQNQRPERQPDFLVGNGAPLWADYITKPDVGNDYASLDNCFTKLIEMAEKLYQTAIDFNN